MGDVAELAELLDLMTAFSSNDQRARFLLSSNWMRDRDGSDRPALNAARLELCRRPAHA